MSELWQAIDRQVDNVSYDDLVTLGAVEGVAPTDRASKGRQLPETVAVYFSGTKEVTLAGPAEEVERIVRDRASELSRFTVRRAPPLPEGRALTATGSRPWQAGRDIGHGQPPAQGLPQALMCSSNYFYRSTAGGLDHWYHTTAGHCVDPAALGNLYGGYFYNGTSTANRMAGPPIAWVHNGGILPMNTSTIDVGVYFAASSAAGTIPPNPVSARVWDYCNGVTCDAGNRGVGRALGGRMNFSVGSAMCKTGASAGTGCATVTGISVWGAMRVGAGAAGGFGDPGECGADQGDSGGAFFGFAGSSPLAVGILTHGDTWTAGVPVGCVDRGVPTGRYMEAQGWTIVVIEAYAGFSLYTG